MTSLDKAVFAWAVFALTMVATPAAETARQTSRATVGDVSGRDLIVRNALGDIEIAGIDDGPLAAEAFAEAWGTESGSAPRLVLEPVVEGSALVLEPRLVAEGDTGRGSRAVRLVVRVPRHAESLRVKSSVGGVRAASGAAKNLVIEGETGPIDVTGWDGPVSVRTRFGDVAVRDAPGRITVDVETGNLTLANVGTVDARVRFGDLAVSRTSGSLTARVGAGNVSARSLGGETEIEAQSANVEVLEARAPLAILSENGRISVRDVRGTLRIVSQSGDVSVERAAASVAVVAQNGAVALDDIGGAASVQSRLGVVRLRRLAAGATVTSGGGDVDIIDVAGVASVAASFGSVSVQGASDRLAITVERGSISVSALRDKALAARHELVAPFGDVRVFWPQGHRLRHRVEARRLAVDAALAGEVSPQDASREALGGEASVHVVAPQGSFEVLLEPAAAAR